MTRNCYDRCPLLADLARQGFTLAAEGDRVRVRPANRLTDALRQVICEHREGLLSLLVAGRAWDQTEADALAVSLDDWKEVVQAAVAQAKEGDGKAREWLARSLIGDDPPRLPELFVDDVLIGGAIGREMLKALIRHVKESRYREQFEADELQEATRLLQDSLARRRYCEEDYNAEA
jgi:hypothetical protein